MYSIPTQGGRARSGLKSSNFIWFNTHWFLRKIFVKFSTIFFSVSEGKQNFVLIFTLYSSLPDELIKLPSRIEYLLGQTRSGIYLEKGGIGWGGESIDLYVYSFLYPFWRNFWFFSYLSELDHVNHSFSPIYLKL